MERRLTPQQAEAEIRRRLCENWLAPERRRLLQRMLVLGRGVKRYREERARRMSVEQLLNNWAAAQPEHPEKLLDLSHLPDLQLVQAVWQLDIGLAAEPAVLADSAIAELATRANNRRMTVADYIRRRT